MRHSLLSRIIGVSPRRTFVEVRCPCICSSIGDVKISLPRAREGRLYRNTSLRASVCMRSTTDSISCRRRFTSEMESVLPAVPVERSTPRDSRYHRRFAFPMFFRVENRRDAREGWTLKKRRNSCEPTSKERFDVGIKRLAGYHRPSFPPKLWEMGISENRIGAARIVPRTVLSLRLRVFRPLLVFIAFAFSIRSSRAPNASRALNSTAPRP